MFVLCNLTGLFNRRRVRGGVQVHYTFSLPILDVTHEFECHLDTRDGSLKVLVGHLGEPWGHVYDARLVKGFWVTDPCLGDDYQALAEILGTVGGADDPWSVADLLAVADTSAATAPVRARLDSCLIPRRLRDDVDEASKTVFKGFIHPDGGRTGPHPTRMNLAKTRIFLGPAVAEYCFRHGISSAWCAPWSCESMQVPRPGLP